ncbi:MAG: large conductance mechanosensitive channel protein MscL [Lachnospiraceae bacterium]|nr:large conductance mechanosensitive channel protein MscL [Lachnospiraceae bacterium]
MQKFISEFKEFISRGNVMDLAVGMIIGSAFTGIVNSLVNDIIMPLISMMTGGISFDEWNFLLTSDENPSSLNVGTFLAQVLNFIIIAFVIFMVIKGLNKLRCMNTKAKAEVPAESPTKICPYCQLTISLRATRCPHCTSVLEQ